MADSTLIADAALALLDTAAAQLDDPPERQLILWTASAIDCAQLDVRPKSPGYVVSLDQRGRAPMTPAMPRREPGVPMVVFQVRLSLECWPAQADLSTIPAATLNAAGSDALTQSWTLWRGLDRLTETSTLFNGVFSRETCAHVLVGPMTPQGPQGGIVTASFDVTAAVIELEP